jgi:release factor glutamine methyltransferase
MPIADECTIGEWLDSARKQLSSSTLFDDDIQLTLKFLLEARLDRPLFFLSDSLLSSNEKNQLDIDLEALYNGKPLPYVIGEWSFYGYEFRITPDVLIPRPETELLVEEALNWLNNNPEETTPIIYDIGTGSGIIAITLAKRFGGSDITASDISPEALNICKKNIQKHNLSHRINPILSDGIPDGQQKIDLLCANLPYIPEKKVDELRVTEYEPRLALDGGPDGLSIVSKVLSDSVTRMKPKSLLLFEIEASQKNPAIQLAEQYYPYSKITIISDLAGKDRLLRIENEWKH